MNDTLGVQQECGNCLLLGSTNRAKSHSTENQWWSAHNHKIIGENVSNPPQNSDRNAQQVHGEKAAKGNRTPSSGIQNPGSPNGSQGTRNQTPSRSGGQLGGQKNSNGTGGTRNQNSGQTPQNGRTKGNAQRAKGRGKGNQSDTSYPVMAAGVAAVEVPHLAAVTAKEQSLCG